MVVIPASARPAEALAWAHFCCPQYTVLLYYLQFPITSTFFSQFQTFPQLFQHLNDCKKCSDYSEKIELMQGIFMQILGFLPPHPHFLTFVYYLYILSISIFPVTLFSRLSSTHRRAGAAARAMSGAKPIPSVSVQDIEAPFFLCLPVTAYRPLQIRGAAAHVIKI